MLPKLYSEQRGVTTAPSANWPTGAPIQVAATSGTLTITSPAARSFPPTMSLLNSVEQRTANGPPRWVGAQSAKVTVKVSPTARPVTVCVSV